MDKQNKRLYEILPNSPGTKEATQRKLLFWLERGYCGYLELRVQVEGDVVSHPVLDLTDDGIRVYGDMPQELADICPLNTAGFCKIFSKGWEKK